MKRWWLRPAVRITSAAVLPLAVPAIITMLIWMLPGDPASVICPPESCGGSSALAARWNLDGGPWKFYMGWLGAALHGDLGASWRLLQGESVRLLLAEAIPNTLMLVGLGLLPILLGTLGAATQRLPARGDPILHVVGLVPALVMALLGAAVIELAYGADSYEGAALWARLIGGAAVLGLADGAFSGAVTGTRGLFRSENKQRYVGIAVLRGERRIHNTLPNAAPALIGQLRARVLHLLSGAVVVEVVIGIDGLGDLLWRGTLLQDFGVVLAAATGFALVSAGLLLTQALVEIGVAVHVRRAPALPSTATTVTERAA